MFFLKNVKHLKPLEFQFLSVCRMPGGFRKAREAIPCALSYFGQDPTKPFRVMIIFVFFLIFEISNFWIFIFLPQI